MDCIVPFKPKGQDKVRDSKDNMGGPWHAGSQRKKRRKDILNTNKWQTKLIAVIADAAFLRRRSAGQQHCLRNPDYTEWEKPHTFGM